MTTASSTAETQPRATRLPPHTEEMTIQRNANLAARYMHSQGRLQEHLDLQRWRVRTHDIRGVPIGGAVIETEVGGFGVKNYPHGVLQDLESAEKEVKEHNDASGEWVY